MATRGGVVIWLTGLSGAGKSTLARRLEQEIALAGRSAVVLDGDEVRQHLSQGLGFSKADRDTNIRRIGWVAGLVAESGGIAVTAAISPYREVRDEVRARVRNFVEVYVGCPLEELIRRDVKGLYRKALSGEIAHFTGVSDPYEPPLSPEVTVDSSAETVEVSLERILTTLERLGHIRRPFAAAGPEDDPSGLREEAAGLPALAVGAKAATDARMLGSGALAPLAGFMSATELAAVVAEGRLPGGEPFTIPVTLRVDEAAAGIARRHPRVALAGPDGPFAVLDVAGVFRADRAEEARRVFGTEELAHPGVRALWDAGEDVVAGPVRVFAPARARFPEYELSPAAVRAAAAERGWRTMVGFQTRNPVHRAHEYLQKVALELVDGLLLHPLVGDTKDDDIPADVRLRCYEALLRGYFPADRVLLATNPAWMRYAGPREAVFHALIRRNYGCTHFIVGRDHAGVGSYYDTYAAHRIFDGYAPGELGIEILRFEHAFHCRRCEGMASTRTCPHPADEHVTLSGTRVREMLEAGVLPPAEFSRPEVAAILVDASREPAAVGGAEARAAS